MTLLQAVILGIIQGLTEFLPISSSAHLVLIPHLLGWELNKDFVFLFDVLVQLGTLVAVIIFYRKDLVEIFNSVIRGLRTLKPFEEEPARVGWLAVLATIPAGLIGLLIKDLVEEAFSSPTLTAVFLFVTAGLLILAEFIGKKNRELESLNWKDALWVGFFQVLSIFPGVSRSGSTIAGGMTRHFGRKPAGQFAFLLAIPILAAAGLLGVLDLLVLEDLAEFLPLMVVGFIVSGMVGYFAIRWLIGYISHNSLLPFAGYCLILGAGSLLLLGLPQASPVLASESPVAPAAPSQEVDVYHVAVEPDLEWLLPAMNACREEFDQLDFFIYQQVAPSATEMADDVFIAYGEIAGLSDAIFQISSDQLVLAVNPSNPLTHSSMELAAGIFSGELAAWSDAAANCEDCFSSTPESSNITVFIYPAESRKREFTRDVLPDGMTFASTALIAPGAKQVRESLATDPAAIGFLPRRWLDGSVKEVAWQGEGVETLSIPILAYTANNFDANLAEWLTCVQNRIG